MRLVVSRGARWFVRREGGDLYLWERNGAFRAGISPLPGKRFAELPGDGFRLHLDATVECPRGLRVSLRPWVQPLQAREAVPRGEVVWRAVAAEHFVPDGGTGSA